MSQTGFPNGGILPDDNEDFTYSNLIATEEQIKAAAAEIVAESYLSSSIEPKIADTVSTGAEGLLTAGLTLAQYFVQQITYQGENGYGTESNPVIINFSNSVKELFAKSLGNEPDSDSLYTSYGASSRNIDGVQNTFFNLGLGKNAFTWDANGNLNISDTYLFTGIDDLGAAPTVDQASSIGGLVIWVAKFAIGLSVGSLLIPIAQLKGNINILAKMLFGAWAPNIVDKTVPFNFLRWVEVNGVNSTNIGAIEPMKFKAQFTPQELYDYNPTLFWNAFRKGLIPYSAVLSLEICSPIEVGSGPTFFLPNYSSVASNIGSNPNNWTYGGGGNYPRPFTSFSQRIVEATYSLGPFAKIGNVSGRIAVKGTVCGGGNYIGQLIFVKQAWAEADLGNSEYTNNGELFKRDWWNQAIKTKHIIRNGNLFGNPFVEVEVATASYTTGSPQKYDPDIPTPEDYTLLLGVVLGAAALGAIL
jgi:hypothetical protein